MDPYDTLNIRKNATKSEIDAAYKKLLDKYNLKNYPGDPTFANRRVEKIVEAYELLSDTKKKFQYDKEHQSHVESHKNQKDVFNPYYKKQSSSEHIHEDMKFAQDKYENFQKYSNKNTYEQSQKAILILVAIFFIFTFIIPILQMFSLLFKEFFTF